MSVKTYAQPSKNFPISRSGDILDTQVTLVGDPVRDNEAATKQYVDVSIAVGDNAGLVPIFLFNRWYFPLYMKDLRSSTEPLTIGRRAYASLRYVGHPVIWSRMRIVGGISPFTPPYDHMIEVGLYEVNSQTLFPTKLVWKSGLVTVTENAVSTKTGLQLKRTFDVEVPNVPTYTPWVAYGVYFHQNGHWLHDLSVGRGTFGFFGASTNDLARMSFMAGPTLNGLPSAFLQHDSGTSTRYVFALAAMPSRFA